MDDDSSSTRFITVTRTFTSSIKPTQTYKEEEETYRTSTPLFQAF